MSAVVQEAMFHWADYLVFLVMLLISCSVGVYHGYQDYRLKRNTVDDFLMAGRSMSILPVSLSMFVSWVSAISFIGDPVEVYYYGISYWILGLGYCMGLPIVAHFFAPKFKEMNIYSAYEFLEKRYNRKIRVLISILQGLYGGIYCGIVIYTPAICVAQVSGISVHISVVILGVICIFYTTLGGMKAVLWADTIQAVLMFVGLATVVIRGTMVVGGLGRIWEVARATGRTRLSWTANPFVRSSVWTYLLGGIGQMVNPYSSTQPFIQRCGTLKTPRDAKIAVYLNIPLYIIFVGLFGLLGLVIAAYFQDCDPLLAGRVDRKDQITPLLVVELFFFLPGFAGMYLASVFNASLSSLSSYLNSLSLTLLVDIVQPTYEKVNKRPMSNSLALKLSKIFCLLIGLTFVGFALIATNMKDTTLFEMTRSILGLLEGPTAAFFILGIYVSFVETKGILLGSAVGTAVMTWWYFGAMFSSNLGPTAQIPVNADNCSQFNLTEAAYNTSDFHWMYQSNADPDSTPERDFSVNTLYKLSPIMYGTTGLCITSTIAIVVGLINKHFTKRQKHSYQIPENNSNEMESL